MVAGTRLDIHARLTNIGDTTLERWWTLDGGHAAVSGHIYSDLGERLGDIGPIALPRDLAPGQSTDLRFRVRLPDAPGRVVLLFDLLIHRWGWLRHRGGEALLLPIDLRRAV